MRKERAGSKRGGWYWKVYHRQGGKLHSAYLGKTEGLTLLRLTTVVQNLASSNPLASLGQENQPENDLSTQAWTAWSIAPLPLPLIPLIGREQDVFRLEAMLRQPERRLVTLTGTGGVGKTHLALHVAKKLALRFVDGVAFISLASVTRSELTLATIAQGHHAEFCVKREKSL